MSFKCGEETLKGLDGPLLTHPEQTGDAEVDLVNQRQIFVALGVLDCIHADGANLAQRAMRQPPGNDMLDRIEDLIPGSSSRIWPFPAFRRKQQGCASFSCPATIRISGVEKVVDAGHSANLPTTNWPVR